MPFQRKKADLVLTDELLAKLESISKSRTEKASRVERAKMLLAYANNASVSPLPGHIRRTVPKWRDVSTKHSNWGFLLP